MSGLLLYNILYPALTVNRIKKGLDRTAKTLNLLHNLLANLRLIRTDSGNLYPEQMSL